MLSPSELLDYGALGVALGILLIAVGVLYRVLQFSRDIFRLTLDRIESNTAALVRLSERLHGNEEED